MTAAPARPRSDGATGGSALRAVFDRLAAAYGPQAWWPARDPFEMMAGALLTQRTTWRNAERAIASLRGAGALSPETWPSFLRRPSKSSYGRPGPSG